MSSTHKGSKRQTPLVSRDRVNAASTKPPLGCLLSRASFGLGHLECNRALIHADWQEKGVGDAISAETFRTPNGNADE
jgi:hypothetical protein